MIVKDPDGKVEVTFEYRDDWTGGEWRRQSCVVRSVEQAKQIYGLGVDCDYRIVSVVER